MFFGIVLSYIDIDGRRQYRWYVITSRARAQWTEMRVCQTDRVVHTFLKDFNLRNLYSSIDNQMI